MKQWELVFTILANINRLKIIKFLCHDEQKDVSTIARHLKITVKATSHHLIMLKNVGVLESTGRRGHVFYQLKDTLPEKFAKAIKLFL